MTNKNQESESRLGHDPLEWLEDDEISESQPTSTETSSDTSSESDDTHDIHATDSAEQEASEPAQIESNESNIPGLSLDGNSGEFTLPDKLMVQIAEDFHQHLCAITQLEDLTELKILAGEVDDIDTAGLQLLYALTKQLSSAGCNVTIEDVPEDLEKIFTLAGLAKYFRAFTHAA